MRTSRLVQAITLIAVFAMAARISVDTDTWWHLRAGEWMIENQTILQVDHFSYTREGALWNYPGWLVEIPMFYLFKWFGPGGLNLWTAAMVTLAFGFVWPTISGGVFLRAFTVVLAAAASGVYWAARPYLVTFVLAAVFLWILEDFRWRKKDRLWLLPILMIIWANSHGGFVVGIILIGIYGIDLSVRWLLIRFSNKHMFLGPQPSQSDDKSEKNPIAKNLRKLFIIGVLTVFAIALNPSGLEMLSYPFKTVSIGALQDYIAEWQSPNFHELRVQPFLWLLLLTIAAIGASRNRLAISDFLLIGVFASLSVMAARNIALFALGAPPVLTRYAAPAIRVWQRRLGFPSKGLERQTQPRVARIFNAVIFALLLVVVVIKAATIVPASVNTDYFHETYPTGAVAYLNDQRPDGRLFNSYNWGGYLLWALPEYPVFIDGRTDLFNDELINTWLQVTRGEGDWESTIDSWDIRLVLVEPSIPLSAQLRAGGWRILHEDAVSVLFERP